MHTTFTFETDGGLVIRKHHASPRLDLLQRIVKGPIETVPHLAVFTYQGVSYKGHAFCNEEGKLLDLPFNTRATHLWLSNLGGGPFRYPPVLLGNVVFVTAQEYTGPGVVA